MAHAEFDPHHQAVDFLREHPGKLAEYLDGAILQAVKIGNWPDFKRSIAAAVDAAGGVTALANKLRMDQGALQNALSPMTPPLLGELAPILHALGLRLAVKKLHLNA